MLNQDQPVACLLPARESRDQIGEWRALVDHQVELRPVEGGYLVTFELGVSAVVEDLARRESECCSFLDIVTKSTPAGMQLSMTSLNPDALPVIELLVGLED